MRLIVMNMEHQMPHVHKEQPHAKCIMCIYKRTSIIQGPAESEAYSIAAGIQQMYTMRQELDKSSMSLRHLQNPKELIQDFNDVILNLVCRDAIEYLYFIDNSETLSQQVLGDIDTYDLVGSYMCSQRLLSSLAAELRKLRPSRERSCRRRLRGECANVETIIEHSNASMLYFVKCARHWLRECYDNDMACQFFGMCIAKKAELFCNRYNVVYNAFSIYSRLVDINLLSGAPYGTVTVGIKTFCKESDVSTILICLAHSKPVAHRLAICSDNSIIARTSVANMRSLLDERQRLLSNYAIYLPFDIDTAIYLRFGSTQIAKLLQKRLQTLSKANVTTNHGSIKFTRLKVSIFFDRGVFCAHMDDAELQDNIQVDALRLELIDIYRNAHWMGLNIFHKDMSLIFPRIIARFGSNGDHSIKVKAASSTISVFTIMLSLNHLLEKASLYVSSLHDDRPKLYAICQTSAEAEMCSKFAIAHEGLRLALSMTHTSVHKYAEYVSTQGNIDLNNYASMSILYYGDLECATCGVLYESLRKDSTSNTTTLLEAYDTWLDCLSVLQDKEYRLPYMSSSLLQKAPVPKTGILRVLFSLCSVIKKDYVICNVPKAQAHKLLERYNAHAGASKYLLSHTHDKTQQDINMLLQVIAHTQTSDNTGSVSDLYELRTEEKILQGISQCLAVTHEQTEPPVELRRTLVTRKRKHGKEKKRSAKKAKTAE